MDEEKNVEITLVDRNRMTNIEMQARANGTSDRVVVCVW